MSNHNEKERRRQRRLEAERAEAARRERRKDFVWFGGAGVAILAAVAIVAVAVASGGGKSETARPAVAAAPAGKGIPPQIAVNLRDGNKVVDGSITDRIDGLKGVPIVVNMWASWCPNCKAEFGYFANLANKYERRVAFLGLDSQDRKGDAEDFLKDNPVNYPSVFDESASQAAGIGAGRAWPTTVFFDRTGRVTYVRQGGYVTEASLEADIRRYALGTT